MNILFIISHDISLRFGCYGDTVAVTPNIDRLASEGMVFHNHFCQYALCAPSRTNIFTGCRPETTGRFDIGDVDWYSGFRRANPGISTLPEHLKRNGFFTKALHKVYHEYEKDALSWSEDPWYAPMEPAQGWMPDDFECLERATRYRDPKNWRLMKDRFDTLVASGPSAATQFKRWRGAAVEAADVTDSAYPAGKVADRFPAELKNARWPGGFFLGVGFSVTHLPWLSPQKYWDLYADIPAPISEHPPAGLPEEYGVLASEAYQYFEQDYQEPGSSRKSWRPSPADTRELIHGHYAAISYLDAQVGRILKNLEESGLREETVVVFTTDHGFALGEHDHWGKNSLHEPDQRVPLIISAPGYSPGHTRALTEHVDLYPTLCELAGVSLPAHLEGSSMVPLLERPERPWKTGVFSHCRHGQGMGISVRTSRYRYTRWHDADGTPAQVELYDYTDDPLETVSVHRDPANAEVLARLDRVMDVGWPGCRPNLSD